MSTTIQEPSMSMPAQDLYRVLNVQPHASSEEVKQAIIRESRLWSNRTNAPQIERRQEAERMVKLLEQAEAILLDPSKRAAYDQQRISMPTAGPAIDEDDLAGKENLVQEAWRFLAEGQVADALFVAERATQRDGNNPDAWAVLAQAKFRWGDIEDAIYEYKRAIKLRPNDAAYYFDFGTVLESADRAADALQQYQRAAQVAPEEPMYRAAVGALLVKNEQYAQGIEILEQCRSEQPDNAQYQWFLAIAYAASATLGWTHVGEGHPLLSEGWYATEHKHITDAQEAIDKALALKFDDPELEAEIQKDRQRIAENLKRSFTCKWFVAIVVSLIGIPALFIPTLLAILYVISSRAPQYKINSRLVQGKQFNEFAFLGSLFGNEIGWIGLLVMYALIIGLMPFVIIVNFVRNYGSK